MSRSHRKFVAWLCFGMLVFLQLATAAYACSMSHGPTPMTSSTDMAPCQGGDEQLPNLCEQHCLQASQSVDTQPNTTITAPSLPLLAVLTEVQQQLPPASRSPWALRIQVVNPPPLIRFGVLRI